LRGAAHWLLSERDIYTSNLRMKSNAKVAHYYKILK